MSLLNNIREFFGKSTEKVKVKQIKQVPINDGIMASACQTEAVKALGSYGPTKVLMIQQDIYYKEVSDYALKIAQKLDCDIIALSTSEKPLTFTEDRKQREIARFKNESIKQLEDFSKKVAKQGIKLEHQIKLGNLEEIVADLSEQEQGIRYVLSSPENNSTTKITVPVYDLKCSKFQPRIAINK